MFVTSVLPIGASSIVIFFPVGNTKFPDIVLPLNFTKVLSNAAMLVEISCQVVPSYIKVRPLSFGVPVCPATI